MRWQEILAALLKTHRIETRVPVLSSKVIAKLRDLFFPAEFFKLVSILNLITEVEDEAVVSVKGLLGLCGWRRKAKEGKAYDLECPSCLKVV